MPRYMLFLHESPENFGALSPDEMMGVIQEYSAWSAALREKGLLAGGEKLTDDMGKVLRPRGAGAVLSDGPYSETKEYIGGYFAILADGYDGAVEIARGCPHLKHGGRIEIREIHEF